MFGQQFYDSANEQELGKAMDAIWSNFFHFIEDFIMLALHFRVVDDKFSMFRKEEPLTSTTSSWAVMTKADGDALLKKLGATPVGGHWSLDDAHGVEREWNEKGTLRPRFPKFYVRGRRVTRKVYERESVGDRSLPPYRIEDNQPQRDFPPVIARRLAK